MSKEKLTVVASDAGATVSGKAGSNTADEDCLTQDGIERLAVAFERSAKRWEMIIYPVMIIFTLFAAYGFYQIYSVTRDLRAAAAQVEPQIGVHLTRLTLSLQNLTDNISDMSKNIQTMQQNVAKMSADIHGMSKQMAHLKSMDQQMLSMNRSMTLMAGNTNRMQWDMAKMNRSFGKPMNFMNSFMPW